MKKLENENSNYPKILNLTMICEMKGPHPGGIFCMCHLQGNRFQYKYPNGQLAETWMETVWNFEVTKILEKASQEVKVDPFLEMAGNHLNLFKCCLLWPIHNGGTSPTV